MFPSAYNIACFDPETATFLESNASIERIERFNQPIMVNYGFPPVHDVIVVYRGNLEEFLPTLLCFMGDINNIFGKLYILFDFNAVNAYSSETLLPIIRCIALRPDKVRILPHILLYKPFQ
jgi:hypothetical protein